MTKPPLFDTITELNSRETSAYYGLTISRGRAVAARVAHNHKVVGSSPAPATKRNLEPSLPGRFLIYPGSGGRTLNRTAKPRFANQDHAQVLAPSMIADYMRVGAIFRPLLVVVGSFVTNTRRSLLRACEEACRRQPRPPQVLAPSNKRVEIVGSVSPNA